MQHEHSPMALHVGLAEQGKIHALAGEHQHALAYYRQAIQVAVTSEAPEAFFRHYTESTLESLERSGAYQEILDYCDRVLDFYATKEFEDPHKRAFAALDTATTHQRKAAVLLKSGSPEEASESLVEALRLADEGGLDLPLARRLHDWTQRRLAVDAQRVTAEQERCGYFSVRRDALEPERAITMSPDLLSVLPAGS